MKENIHPDYHEITIKMTNGKTFTTRSTWGKKGDVMTLDIDPLTHPAWTGAGSVVNDKVSNVAKFNERFGGLSFGGKKAAAAPAAEKKDAPAKPAAEKKPAAKKADKK